MHLEVTKIQGLTACPRTLYTKHVRLCVHVWNMFAQKIMHIELMLDNSLVAENFGRPTMIYGFSRRCTDFLLLAERNHQPTARLVDRFAHPTKGEVDRMAF